MYCRNDVILLYYADLYYIFIILEAAKGYRFVRPLIWVVNLKPTNNYIYMCLKFTISLYLLNFFGYVTTVSLAGKFYCLQILVPQGFTFGLCFICTGNGYWFVSKSLST